MSDTVQNTEIGKSFFANLEVDGLAIYDKNEEIDNDILIGKYQGEVVITFNANGGTVSEEKKTVVTTLTYGELPTPTRTDTVVYETNGGSDVSFVNNSLSSSENLFLDEQYSSNSKIKFLTDIPNIITIDYTFEGWYLDQKFTKPVTSETIVDIYTNFTLYAKWSGDNEITLPNTSRTNYQFDGWYSDDTFQNKIGNAGEKYTVNGSITFYSKWTRVSFTLTSNNNGGSGCGSQTISLNNSTYGTLCTPTKAGYTFDGWYTSSNGGTLVTNNTTIPEKENHTLYATWQANTYTVSYDYNHSQTFANTLYMDTGYKINWDNDFKIETTVNIPTAGNRYLIIGSYADSVATNLSIEVDTSNALRVYMATGQVDKTFGTVTVGENINVVYIWTASTNTYTITATGTTTNISFSGTYDMSGTAVNALRVGTVDNRGTSTVFSSITMNSLKISNPQTYATTLSNLPSASQTGYTFNGFYTAASGGTQITTSTTMGASDVTYYGRWTANTYTVTLNNQSATTVGTTTYYYQYNTTKTVNGVTAYYYTDSALTTPLTNGTTITIPTKTGYTFGGYYTGTDGTGTQYVNSSGGTINNRYKVAGDITLYAKWTINSYTLTVNPNGGTWNSSTSNSTFTQNYGTTKSIAVPSATPYYTITYNGNSGTTPSATKAYRAFTGWTKSGSGSITATTPLATTTQTYTFGAGNGTLTAGYNSTANSTTTAKSSRSYTITYNTNSTGATSSATSGTVAYTMNGWYTATSGGTKRATNGGAYAPTKSETVYAQWSAGTTTLATITKSGSYCTWNTKSDGSGTNYVSGATGYTTSAAVTLYAKCIVKNYEISSGSSPYADTFANAISWSNAGATVKLLNSISDNSGGAIDRNLTFNTNGKTLTRTTQIKINSGKTVTLSGNGKITTTTSSSVKTVYNSGNLTINGPILAGTGTGATLYINSTGTTTFSNGTITNSASGYSSFYVDASSTGNVSITGGSITTTGTNAASAITCYGAVNLSISGVTVNAYYRALANYASCKTTITSGTFSASQMQTIRNWGQMAISGGTFTSGANSVIHNGSSDDATGLLFITGGTFSLTDSSNYTVIRNYSEQVWPTASTTGYIKCCTQADSIHMGGTATVSNTGAGKGVINSSSTRGFHTPASYTGYIYSKSNYAVQASSGNIQINGGTIYASSSSYYSSGTVTFGSGATKTTGSHKLEILSFI